MVKRVINFKSEADNITLGAEVNPSAKLVEDSLPNQKYVDLAKKVYMLHIYNGYLLSKWIAWILDYKLSDDGTYLVTWYFGSNAHVIDNLRIYDDKQYPGRFAK